VTEQAYHDMLLTAAMQSRLACAGSSETSIEALAKRSGAKNCGVLVAAYVTASWLDFGDHMHVSIHGTNDAHDWIQNLSARQVSFSGMTCHAGFYRSAVAITDEMIRVLRFPLHRPVVIGGHSAGGAIAEIASVLAKSFMYPREIVTFGSPRVWSASTAPIFRSLGHDVHRFVVSGDPVPALPFRQFRRLFGKAQYAHAHQSLEITADGRVLLDRGNSSLRKAVAIASGAWLCGLASVGMVREWVPTLLSRHYVSNYRDCILAAVARIEAQ
jgi:hypothetical protein